MRATIVLEGRSGCPQVHGYTCDWIPTRLLVFIILDKDIKVYADQSDREEQR